MHKNNNKPHANTFSPTIDLLAPAMSVNPFDTYTLLRENYPVCRVNSNGVWAISRYQDVRFALINHQLFSSAGIGKTLLPSCTDPQCIRDYIMVLTVSGLLHM